MSGGSWGNVWGDAEDAFDRIKLTTPVGDKMAVIAIIQKSVENDYAATPNVSDGDADAYYLAVNYAAETFSTGLLTAWARNATLSDNSLAPNNFIEDRFYLVPYVKAALADGKVNILCDLQYEFGTREFLSAGASDADISAFSGMLEVNGAVGKFGWEVGYGYMGGQDVNDDKITAANMAYKGVGLDWDKFVYFSDTAGVGLLNDAWYTGTPGGAVNVQNGGVSTWWLGGSFAVKENLKLSLLFGQAMALETDSNWADDNYGSELDFKLGWNITENLDYNFNFGYVMAGDAAASIQGITTSELEDQYKIYHKLQLNF